MNKIPETKQKTSSKTLCLIVQVRDDILLYSTFGTQVTQMMTAIIKRSVPSPFRENYFPGRHSKIISLSLRHFSACLFEIRIEGVSLSFSKPLYNCCQPLVTTYFYP